MSKYSLFACLSFSLSLSLARAPAFSLSKRADILCGVLDDGARHARVVGRLRVLAELADVHELLALAVLLWVQHVVAIRRGQHGAEGVNVRRKATGERA